MTTTQQSSFALTKPEFKTVDEKIFPSLHPFGAFYRKQPVLQKRAADNTIPCSSEPLNKLRINNGAEQKRVEVINYHSKDVYPDNEFNWLPQRALGSVNIENIDFKKVEEKILSFYKAFLDANFTDNSQALVLFIDALQQQAKLKTQIEERRIDLTSEKENISYSKRTEAKKAISDSSTNDGDTEEEVNTSKKEEVVSTQANRSERTQKKMLLDPKLAVRQQTRMKKLGYVEPTRHNDDNDSLVIEIIEEESVHQDCSTESESSIFAKQTLMPGFHDKIDAQVSVGSEFQAVLLPFESRRGRRAPKRKAKLIWPVERRNAREIDLLTGKLEKMLNINITNQVKICQLFKEHNLKIKDCLDRIAKEKNRFKYELKNKRIVNSTQKRNLEFVFDGY